MRCQGSNLDLPYARQVPYSLYLSITLASLVVLTYIFIASEVILKNLIYFGLIGIVTYFHFVEEGLSHIQWYSDFCTERPLLSVDSHRAIFNAGD